MKPAVQLQKIPKSSKIRFDGFGISNTQVVQLPPFSYPSATNGTRSAKNSSRDNLHTFAACKRKWLARRTGLIRVLSSVKWPMFLCNVSLIAACRLVFWGKRLGQERSRVTIRTWEFEQIEQHSYHKVSGGHDFRNFHTFSHNFGLGSPELWLCEQIGKTGWHRQCCRKWKPEHAAWPTVGQGACSIYTISLKPCVRVTKISLPSHWRSQHAPGLDTCCHPSSCCDSLNI